MYKKILPFILFCSVTYAQISKDTIYLNASKEITTKANATHYVVENDHGTTPSYYTLYDLSNQQMLMQGKALIEGDSTFIWVGEVNSFYNGNLLTNVFFFDHDGQYNKVDSYHPITKEKFTILFEDGEMTNGSLSTVDYGQIIYIEIENGQYKLIEYSDLENPLNRIKYQYENEQLIQNSYFDSKGDLLYSCTYQDANPYNGTIALTYSQSLLIDYVTTYKDGEEVKVEGFYSNGAKKYITTTSSEYTTSIFFDKDGAIMGEYFINNTSFYKQGKDFSFDYQNQTHDRIASSMEYKDDLLYSVSYYDIESDLNPIKETYYYDINQQIDSIQYFDANQRLLSTLTYLEYSPLNGTKYDENQITTFKDARVIKQTTYYPNTKILFESFANNKSTYYDYQQNIIGTLDYNPQETSYLEPYNGDYYALESQGITEKSTYKNGYVTERETFYPTQNFTEKLRPASRVLTELGKTTKTFLYPNGNIREISNYITSNYQDSLSNAKYYHPNNTLMGQFQADKGQGTIIEFSEQNIPIKFQDYKNAELVSQKVYCLKESNFWDEDIEETADSYYLQREIDFNKQGIFYDYHNGTSSVVEYKNRLPYNGEVWLIDAYNFTKIPYLDGKIHGVKQQLSTADYLSVVSKEYYQNGDLIKEEVLYEGELQQQTHYKDGLKDGLYLSYDIFSEDGYTSKIEYKQGEPYEGFLQENFYYYTVTSTYKNGLIQRKNYHFDTSDQISAEDIYLDENTFTRIWYKEEETLVSYQVKNDLLHGDVIFFKEGKPQDKVQFDNGALVEGKIKLWTKALAGQYSYDPFSIEEQESYYLWNKNKNKVDLQIYTQSDNELIYHLEAKIRKDNPQSDVLGIKEVSPCQLFLDFKEHQTLCQQGIYY